MTQREILDAAFLEMRWRCLSLAADLDRLERGVSATDRSNPDPRLTKLRDAFKVLLSDEPERAAKVQIIFSDLTPPPAR